MWCVHLNGAVSVHLKQNRDHREGRRFPRHTFLSDQFHHNAGVEPEIDQRRRSQVRIEHMELPLCHASHGGSEFREEGVGVLRHWECRSHETQMQSLPGRDEPPKQA